MRPLADTLLSLGIEMGWGLGLASMRCWNRISRLPSEGLTLSKEQMIGVEGSGGSGRGGGELELECKK